MSFVPRFKLYNSTGVTLLHTFEAVQESNYPQSPRKVVEVESQRGKGSVIIDGGDSPWDLFIRGITFSTEADGGEAYKELIDNIDTMESIIALNTRYILKIDKDESEKYEYKVKRILPIEYTSVNFRTGSIEYVVTFRVASW